MNSNVAGIGGLVRNLQSRVTNLPRRVVHPSVSPHVTCDKCEQGLRGKPRSILQFQWLQALILPTIRSKLGETRIIQILLWNTKSEFEPPRYLYCAADCRGCG